MSLPLSRQLEELHTRPFVAINGHSERCVRLGHADHPGDPLNLLHLLTLLLSRLLFLLSQLECNLRIEVFVCNLLRMYFQTFGFFSFVWKVIEKEWCESGGWLSIGEVDKWEIARLRKLVLIEDFGSEASFLDFSVSCFLSPFSLLVPPKSLSDVFSAVAGPQ